MGAINEMLDYDPQSLQEDKQPMFSYDNRYKNLEKFKNKEKTPETHIGIYLFIYQLKSSYRASNRYSFYSIPQKN